MSIQIESNLDNSAMMAVRASGFKTSNSSVGWFGTTYIPTGLFMGLIEVSSTLYRMGHFAKEFLDIKSVYSVDELVKDNTDIIRYLNLTTPEEEALALLGEPRRFKSMGQLDSPFLYDEQGNFLPTTEALTKQLISPWTGTFGNPAIWENPKENMGLSRPTSLIPFNRLAKLHKAYTREKASSLSHLFKENLSSPQLTENLLQRFYTSDIEPREASINALKAIKDMNYHLKLDETVTVPAFNTFLVEDIRSQIVDFRKDTK
jgi:hypothetical protein